MDEELEVVFPWIPLIKRGFLKSFSGDYEVGILQLLQQNIIEEFLKVKHQYDMKRGKLLFQCVEYFYYHFCRKWYQWKKFSSHMEAVWVHILTSYLKISLHLSQGKKKSKWINQVLTAIMRFPGEKNLMYDALLSVNCLNKKNQPVYGSILMHLLIYASSFVPMIISDPAEYLKLCLLFRRLKLLIKDPTEKAELQMKASKILSPSTLSNWLLVHDFSVTWMDKAVRIDLRVNIFKTLGGKECEKEVVGMLRKILLPRICTERKAKRERRLYDLNETDQFSNKSNNIVSNFDNRPLFATNSFKKRNNVCVEYDAWVPSEDDKEITVNETKVKNKKMRNIKNSVCLESDNQAPSVEDSTVEHALNEMELNSKKKKMKRNCVSADGKKQVQMKKPEKEQQSAFICNDGAQAESKSLKKKQRIDILKKAETMNEASNEHSFLKNISQATKNRKTNLKVLRTKGSDINSKGIELIIVSQESDADSSSDIVDKNKASESKFRNVNSVTSCSEDEPVIVTEIRHYPIVGRSSTESKKSKGTEAKTETAAENNFFIDTEPTTEFGAVQITKDTICVSEKSYATSCEKPQNISEDFNAPVSLVNLQDKKSLLEPNTRLKIADKSHSSEEKEDSCTSNSSLLKNDHNEIFLVESVSSIVEESLISKEETRLSSGEQTDINVNSQDYRQDGGSIISTNVEECLPRVNQTDKESSTILIESLNNSSNEASDIIENIGDGKSDQISEKPGDKSEKFTIQVNLKKETTGKTYISQEDIPELDSQGICLSDHSSLNDDRCVQETGVQKDDCASIENDKIDFSETKRINAEMAGSNSQVIEKSELEIERSSLSCLAAEAKITQEKIVSELSVNPPLSDNSALKVDGTVQATDSVELKNDIPSSLNDDKCVQEAEVQKDDCASIETDKLVSGAGKIDVLKVQATDSVELKNKVPSESKSFVQLMNSFSEEIEIKKENLVIDSSLQNKNDSEMVSNASTNVPLEVYKPTVLNDNTSIDLHSPSQNNSIHELPSYKMPGLFSGVRSVDQQILNENQNMGVKAKSDEVQTPNSSAANRLMENMLNLVEKASYAKNEFGTRSILKGNLTPTVHNLALKFLSSVTSPKDEISGKCLTFLDISTESVGGHSENESFTSHASKSPEFLQYRDILIDQDDIKSEDTLSENKSVSKADASSDADGEESNSLSDCESFSDCVHEASNSKNNSDTMERHQLGKEDNDESDKKELQVIGVDISKIGMLNPVVNLGERCDSKTFISAISSVSSELSPLSGIRNKNQEINQEHSTICVNETTKRPEVVEGSPPNMIEMFVAEDDEISQVKNDAKIKIQPGQKDLNEKCSVSDQEITVSKESQKSVELASEKDLSQHPEGIGYDKGRELTVCNEDQESVELTSEKELSQEGTKFDKGRELTVCNEDQESIELTSEKELSEDQDSTNGKKGRELTEKGKESFMLSLSMRKLRNKPVSATQTQKSSLADEDCSLLSQNSPVRSLRSRNPSTSSSQEVRKSRSQTVTRRSSKRLKKEANMNLDFDLSELSLNSPKVLKSKCSESSDNSSSEIMNDPPAVNQAKPCRRSTRAPIIYVETIVKDQDTDPEGYNLRSRKSVIMPGKLKI